MRKQAFEEAAKVAETVWPNSGPLDVGHGSRIAAAIRALSAEPAQGEQWKPIETAPKNNRILVLQSCNGLIAVAHWDDWNEHWSTGGGCMNFIAGVTHWMPLPAAPTTEAGK